MWGDEFQPSTAEQRLEEEEMVSWRMGMEGAEKEGEEKEK